ncbi:MAG TPA: hypothetical protein VKB58_02170 [Terriglobales bacterium]|jgi:hypothetical protein|nr:hypothetical protein [Terriglobales bacterium]
MRRLSCLLAALICLSSFASADIKIKTRTTVMGHSSESTVYIKGPRERSEMSYGGHGGSASIIQCDQKRMITVMPNNECMVTPMGGGESACPAVPNLRSMAKIMSGGEPEVPRKGGVVTITRTSTDTGERQDMFGYKARHIKSSISMESSPDACNQSHTKMEMDGWYADLSAGLSCGDEGYRNMACGGPGAQRGCSDRIVLKGGGGVPLGFPLKQTMTMTSEHGNFTTATEVVELTNATLDEPLFEMPPGCKVMDMTALMGGAATTAPAPSQPAPAAAAPPPAPKAPPTPSVAPKAAGVTRVGVVKIKDMSGESLPTDNLRLDLMSELQRQQFEAIPLDADSPQADVETEARSKQCDYVLYTVATQVKAPNSGTIPAASLPKGVALDPSKYQALTAVTLYKIGKPQPELKDVPLAADAGTFAVDAVSATFVQESNRVAQQVGDDAHPKPAAAKTTKPAAKSGTAAKPH